MRPALFREAYRPGQLVTSGATPVPPSRIFQMQPKLADALAYEGKAPTFYELDGNNPEHVDTFVRVFDKVRKSRGANVHNLAPQAANGRLFLAEDNNAGFVLTQDGDIASFFNIRKDAGNRRKINKAMAAFAVEQGGRTFDAYDGEQVEDVSAAGLSAVARVPFDPMLADGYAGDEDVVYMALDPSQRNAYRPGDGDAMAYPGDAQMAQRNAVQMAYQTGQASPLGAIDRDGVAGLQTLAFEPDQGQQGYVQMAGLFRQAMKRAAQMTTPDATEGAQGPQIDPAMRQQLEGTEGEPPPSTPAQQPPTSQPPAQASPLRDPNAPQNGGRVGAEQPRRRRPIRLPEVDQQDAEMVAKAFEANRVNPVPAGAKPSTGETFNYDRLDTPDAIIQMIRTEAMSDDYTKPTRGVQTFDDTVAQAKAELADMAGVTEKVLTRRAGELWNAEELLAARTIMVRSATRLKELADVASAPGSGQQALLQFHKHLRVHRAIQQQVKGAQTEVARSLSAMRISVDGQLVGDQIDDLLESLGGEATARTALDMFQTLADDPQAVGRFTNRMGGKWQMTKDAMFGFWVNILLSAPPTHIANVVGNGLYSGWKVAERGVAGVANAGASAVMGRQVGTVRAGEAPMMVMGMAAGIKDVAKLLALQAQAKLNPSKRGKAEAFERLLNAIGYDDQMRKAEGVNRNALRPARYASNPGIGMQLLDGLGAVVSTPTEFLGFQDGLFKVMMWRAEEHAIAYRRAANAKRLGASADEAAEIFSQYLENPDQELGDMATALARETTFTTALKQGSPIAFFDKLANARWGGEQGFAVGRAFFPFIRTPYNVLAASGNLMMPLPALVKGTRGQREQAVARMAMTSSMMGVVGLMASGEEPMFTGMLSDDYKVNAAIEQASGMIPYAFRVGDTWVSYNRLEPISIPIAIAAEIADFARLSSDTRQAQDFMTDLINVTVNSFMEKPFVSGFGEIAAIIENPGYFGPAFVKDHTASMFTPSLTRRIANSMDPETVDRRVDQPSDPIEYARQTESLDGWLLDQFADIRNRIRAATPGAKGGMPMRLDPFGEPYRRTSDSWFYDFASPFTARAYAPSKMAEEFIDLNWAPSADKDAIASVDLTPAESRRFLELRGRHVQNGMTFKDAIENEIRSERYAMMTRDERREQLRNIESDYSGTFTGGRATGATADLLAESPDLINRIQRRYDMIQQGILK